MGSRRRCCCRGTCNPTFCVTVCASPAIALYGALVQVYGGATLLGSCTTNSSGCCRITGLAAGTYTVKVTFNGTVIHSSTAPVVCGTNNIPIPTPSNMVCCGASYVPDTLTATSSAGTFTMGYYGAGPGGYPTWYGCIYGTSVACTVTNPTSCLTGAPTSQPVKVCYELQCVWPTSPRFAMTRYWGWVYEYGTFTAFNYADGLSCPTPGTSCGAGPPVACGTPHIASATGSANPTTSTPFAITFAMTDNPANPVPDPDSGSITLTQ